MRTRSRTRAVQNRLAAQNRKSLRLAEQAAILSLLKQRNLAVSKSTVVDTVAINLAQSIKDSIWQFKSLSRKSGSASLIREIESIDNDPELDTIDQDFSEYSATDWINARSTAIKYSALWLTAARSNRNNTDAASALTLYRLQTIAATESAKAFNEGRTATLDQIADQYPNLYKRWDSTFDLTTCQTCGSSDGETILATEQFANGEPGSVHINCRCTYTILTEAEVKP